MPIHRTICGHDSTYETDNEEKVEHDVQETTDDFTSEQGSTSQEEDAQSSVPEEP